MKKRTFIKALTIALSLVLMATSIPTINTFAAANANQYAYSIGCDHGDWAWLLGGNDGDFTDNVNYAATCYGMISGITSSYKNYKPDVDYMHGNNPSGVRRIASKVVFLNGHATSQYLLFNHNNKGGVYATGVCFGTDSIGNTGYQYAGLTSTNMSTCDHISFVGCDTASNGNNNLTWKAVNRGATSALGFTGLIHSRSDAGKKWLKKYNDGLAAGYTVSYCLTYATAFSSTSDLATYAKLYGATSNTVTDSKAGNNIPFNTVATNISVKGIENSVEVKATENVKMISSIVASIRKMDVNFDLSDYKMTVNMFAPQDGNGMIIFSYYMNDKIKTNKAYIAVIENNTVVEVIANDVATKEQKGEFSTKGISEKPLVAIVEDHIAGKSSLTVDTAKNLIKTTKNYYYDYLTGELVCEESAFYSISEADGVIVDHTIKTALN